MIVVKSKNKIPIRLTTERWQHIIHRHPEMEDEKERVLETITNPQLTQEGDFGELIALRFYEKTPLTSKYLVTIYKEASETDGFIITAYFASKPSEKRRVLWRQ